MAVFGPCDMAGGQAHVYDGFTFGEIRGICHPWFITHYLKEKTFTTWWASASDNDFVRKIVREGLV